MTHDEIFEELCAWRPEYEVTVVRYEPWGSSSIVIWLDNGSAFKVKRHGEGRFVIQALTRKDIERKFGVDI